MLMNIRSPGGEHRRVSRPGKGPSMTLEDTGEIDEYPTGAALCAGADGLGPGAHSPRQRLQRQQGRSDGSGAGGVIGPTTGPPAQYGGRIFLAGVEVAVDEINRAGGINGRQVKLQRFDDAGDTTRRCGAVFPLAFAGVAALTHLGLLARAQGLNALSLSVATIGLGAALGAVATISWGPDVRFAVDVQSDGRIVVGRVPTTSIDVATVSICVVCLVLLMSVMYFTRTGLRMLATADSTVLAANAGVRSGRMATLAGGLAGAIAALAGACYSLRGTLSPATIFASSGRPRGKRRARAARGPGAAATSANVISVNRNCKPHVDVLATGV